MGYKILYDPELKRKFPLTKKSSPEHKKIIIIIVMAFILLVGIIKSIDRRSAHGGDLGVTNGAFVEMLEDLDAGETMVEALSDFCVKVIENETDR